MVITLFEPFRAVFYTPFYAAHALDAYGAEGVDVRMVTAGAEATVSGLIDGSTDVSWGGPMRIQYTYDQQPDCAVVSFCEIVTRDPFFIVGREPRPDFLMSDLMNIRFGSVSEVNTPWLCLQEDLRGKRHRLAGRRSGCHPDFPALRGTACRRWHGPYLVRRRRQGRDQLHHAERRKGHVAKQT
jgi:hypothetical protein